MAWHDGGKPVLSSARLQWVKQSWKDAEKVLKRGGEDNLTVLPEKDPLTIRAQYWLDALDESLRAQYQEAMKTVPRPIAVVIRDSSANAFVLEEKACVRLPTEIHSDPVGNIGAPGVMNRVENIERIEMDGENAARDYGTCEHDLTKVFSGPAIAEFFGPKLKHCELTWEGWHLVYRNVRGDPKACIEDLGPRALGNGVSWNATLNLIFVNTGMFSESRSDAELVVTLAHELGHYYRAQQLHDRYNFFYELRAGGIPHHPDAVADSEELVKEYTLYQESLPSGLSEWGTLKPSLQRWLVQNAAQFFLGAQACKDAKSVYGTLDFKNEVIHPLDRDNEDKPISKSGETLYRQFEAAALNCMKTFTLQDHAASTTSLLANLSGTLPDGVMTKIEVPKEGTVVDLLNAVQIAIEKYQTGEAAFLKKITDRRLGLYTTEQEADDMEVELSSRVGFTGEEILSAELAFQTVSERKDRESYRPGNVFAKPLMDECARMLRNNWEGSPFVGIGALDDEHHSGCFRVYNVDQEIRAHRYPRFKPIEIPAIPSFESLRTLAKSANELKVI